MTRIGSVGAIKNSSAVRWRLRPEAGPVPNYLVDATFNYFTRTQWSNNVMHLRAFRPILPPPAQDSGGDKWAVVADPEPVAQKFRLRGRPHAEWTILPLSSRVNRLCDLPATRVERNGLGVVRADSTTPVLDFEIECGLRNTLQPPPGPSDLGVPPDLEPVLRPLEQELGLHKMTPEAAAAAVSRHFQTRFQYTLDPEGASLEDFLTRTHAGHCEYFGTATTLLLRAAGIPARYQTGFSVAEFDAKTNQWIVRGTHAHAWCVAWIDGDWRIVDSTPSDWLARDSDRIPFWQNFLDWWDEKWMAFEIWRETSQASAVVGRSIPWILAAVILYTVVRFWMGRRRSAARRTGPAGPAYDPDRITSAWASVRPVVERACGPRPPALPTLAWIEAMTSWPPEVRTAAVRLVRDHYRRRFGESGRSVASDDDLADSARVVMKHAESIGPTP